MNTTHPSFTKMIYGLTSLSGLTETQLKKVVNPHTIATVYKVVFTHSSVSKDNYEFYEFRGDGVVNKAIVNFIIDRFPQLCMPEGVPILTNLKNRLQSTQVLSRLGRQLKITRFLDQAPDVPINIEAVSEDIFEAYFGATEMLVDSIVSGVGYTACQRILFKILEREQISLAFEDIYFSKSIVKEFLEKAPHKGEFKFKRERNGKMVSSSVFITLNGVTYNAGTGEGRKNAAADELACKQAVRFLADELHLPIRAFDTLEGKTKEEIRELLNAGSAV